MAAQVVIEGLLVRIRTLERDVQVLTRNARAGVETVAAGLETTRAEMSAGFDRLTDTIGGVASSHAGQLETLSKLPLGFLPCTRFLDESASSGHDLRINVSYPESRAEFAFHGFSDTRYTYVNVSVVRAGTRFFATAMDSNGDEYDTLECPSTLDLDYLFDFLLIDVYSAENGATLPLSFSGTNETSAQLPLPALAPSVLPVPPTFPVISENPSEDAETPAPGEVERPPSSLGTPSRKERRPIGKRVKP